MPKEWYWWLAAQLCLFPVPGVRAALKLVLIVINSVEDIMDDLITRGLRLLVPPIDRDMLRPNVDCQLLGPDVLYVVCDLLEFVL